MKENEKNQKIATDVLTAVGGKENVSSVVHCMTRLRFSVKDESIPVLEELKNISGVIGAQYSGGQLQVIIGQNVDSVYNYLCKASGFEMQHAIDEMVSEDGETKNKKWTAKAQGEAILDGLSGSLTPAIPILMASAMCKMLVALLGPTMIGLFSQTSNLNTLLTFVGDAGFYFLPIFVGYTSAKKFNANPMLGMFLGAILLHPTFVGIATAGQSFSVFGIPCRVQNYSSTILPIIISVWVMSYIQKGLKKVMPAVLRTVFEPFLTILIMLPITLCVLGPAGGYGGIGLNALILFLSNHFGFLTLGILGAFGQFIILTGMHLVLITSVILSFTTNGYEGMLIPALGASVCSIAGMSVAAAIRIKNKEQRGLAWGYFASIMFGGVSEPALYGIALRYKRPLIGMIAGGFAGGLYAGLTGIKAFSFAVGGAWISTWLPYVTGGTANVINAVITAIISFVVGFLVTYFIGFKKNDPLLQAK